MENTSDFKNAPSPMSSEGYLTLRIGTAGGALPIVGADIRIVGADPENEGVVYLLTSDQSGKTQRITLPAPPKTLSQSPGSAAESYATYNITVFKDGFYTQRILRLPVFPTVTSTQFVEMIPLPPFAPMQNPPTQELITVEKTPFSEGDSR